NDVGQLIPELDRLWAAIQEGRQGPALLDVTAKALLADIAVGSHAPLQARRDQGVPPVVSPKPVDIEELARLLSRWQRPLLLVGGGVITAGATEELRQVAERLGAPVFNSLMGKCVLPTDHPLAAGMPWRQSTSDTTDMASRISPLFQETDGLLAVGCRF